MIIVKKEGRRQVAGDLPCLHHPLPSLLQQQAEEQYNGKEYYYQMGQIMPVCTKELLAPSALPHASAALPNSHAPPAFLHFRPSFKILSDFCWFKLKFTFRMICNIFIMKMNSPPSSNDENSSATLQKIDPHQFLPPNPALSGESNSICLRNGKKKRILKKPESLLGRLRLESPLSFSNVHNVFNILALNQSALRSADYEESYFKTMFYLRAVERVELRKHALILQLKSVDKHVQPIQYLINRYKSFGDNKFYKLAVALERTAAKLHSHHATFSDELMRSFDGEPLSRFIDSMAGETYMCKVAPNKLVISRELLRLLGEDPEAYAIQICKYKMPLCEIISAERYSEIMMKSIDNLGLVSDFVKGKLTHDELHAQTSINFNDFIYNRHHKRIYCNFLLFMPTPQMSCVQMREIIREGHHPRLKCPAAEHKRELMDAHCQHRRFSEAEILRNIIKLPEGMLKHNVRRVATYKQVPHLRLD